MAKKTEFLRTALRLGFVFVNLVASLVASQPSRAAAAEALEELRIREVVNSVVIRDSNGAKSHAARVNEVLDRNRVLITGVRSRAELQASDGTVTRVGANSVFSLGEGKRQLYLEKGTLLFHSPAGKGGGVIRSSGAMASVLGTSIVVSATQDGGFKLLVLEGNAKATLPKGESISLGAGQLTFIMPGNRGNGGFGPLVNFRLQEQVAGAKLVNAFKAPLASLSKIKSAVEAQEKKIAEGKMEVTPMRVLGTAGFDTSALQMIRIENKDPKPFSKARPESDPIRDRPVEPVYKKWSGEFLPR